MNIKVLSIEPANELGTFNMIVLLDREQHHFTMTAETATASGQTLPLIKGDRHFCKTFRWNQEANVKLYKLLSQFNQGDSIEFPISIGDFEFIERERFSLKKEAKTFQK
ncbi:hypothetical protein BCD67_22050 [Oscillatoriales cyanobacterium USR001]|nr:hypothetical protein BCD67_22050 [Oscillatoriales cyanobacterium USR001]